MLNNMIKSGKTIFHFVSYFSILFSNIIFSKLFLCRNSNNLTSLININVIDFKNQFSTSKIGKEQIDK